MQCEFVNPSENPNWNQQIFECPGATAFHTAEWARVLAESYNYQPVYAVFTDREKTLAVIPIMEVRSLFTGRRGVSLPFSDECQPLLHDHAILPKLLETIREFGIKRRWSYFELRGGENVSNADRSNTFLAHNVAIDPKEEAQFQTLRDSTRRNIQKALREGVDVMHFQTREAIDIFYSLHCRTRKKHGLPPQPIRFFHLIHTILIDAGLGFVSLARIKGQWIAGAVYFRFGGRSVYKFGASDANFLHLRPNNLLMWQAISKLRGEGATSLSLGRTDSNDAGLLQFKRGWGGNEAPLDYYRLAIGRKLSTRHQNSDSEPGFSQTIVRRLPLPVLRWVGSVLYRHMG